MLLGQELKFKNKLCNLKLGTFFSALPGLGASALSGRVELTCETTVYYQKAICFPISMNSAFTMSISFHIAISDSNAARLEMSSP